MPHFPLIKLIIAAGIRETVAVVIAATVTEVKVKVEKNKKLTLEYC